ncbi:MAG: ribonuclease III [Pseudomonadota bacterium]
MSVVNPLAPLCKKLGHSFRDESLLNRALTHRSVGSANNERLEFLGDSILNMVIAEALFLRRPDFSEGELSRMRANLVRGETLAEIGGEIGLSEYLKLGQGELKSGGFERNSIVSDCVEALIGAIYLDAEFATCRASVLGLYRSRLDNLPDAESLKDPKTRLQEYLQASGHDLPQYTVIAKEGKSHEQQFVVSCDVAVLDLHAEAKALGRRRAEQAAAAQVLANIGIE